jgi:hypothetical protein
MSNQSAWSRFRDDKDLRDKLIGIYIGIVAVLLAVCGMGGANATKDATRANIDAANTWAFFQAKNLRRSAINLQVDMLALQLKTDSALSAEARREIETKITAYKEQVARLTTDKSTNEGLDELFARGKALELERDTAMKRDPYFDWSQALLQIAIVLASVCLVSPNLPLLALSALVAFLGSGLLVNGYTLMIPIPFIG